MRMHLIRLFIQQNLDFKHEIGDLTQLSSLFLISFFAQFDNIDCNVSEPSSAAKEPEEAGTSNRPSIPDNLMELHHENRAEFFETVQLHCKAVMERVRAVKESLNLSDPSKQSQRSSDKEKLSDFSPERTEGQKGQCFGLNAQDQGQKIKENVERIIELVRSGKKVG